MGFKDFLPILSSAGIALATLMGVHLLTQRRERDKAVFELHRSAVELGKKLLETVEAGWTASSPSKRKEAVAETLWQLQRLGGMTEQTRRLSKRRKYLVFKHELNGAALVAQLRDAITLGDFEDESRGARPSEVRCIRDAIATFVEGLDAELYRWMA